MSIQALYDAVSNWTAVGFAKFYAVLLFLLLSVSMMLPCCTANVAAPTQAMILD